MKLKSGLFFFALCLLFSCTHSTKNKFTWLEGKWVQTNGEANFQEEWTRVNDTLLVGKGFVLEGTDTLFSERLVLQTVGEATIYRVELMTGRIADFKLSNESDTELVFELPENDFPSKIVYTLKSEKELLVLLEGTENGKEIKEGLLFKKQ